MNDVDLTQRREAYSALVTDIKQKLRNRPFGMLGSEECEEINLWSYWQGGRNHLNAKILLVGQDWGAIGTPKRKAQLNRICRTTPDDCNYLHETIGISDTDKNLIALFRSIGYDIENQKYPELFFTNYAIGYRSNRDTGAIPLKAWLQESEPYMQRLIEIINPDVILCLGKNVYQAVLKLDRNHKAKKFKSWNRCIEAGGVRIICGNRSVYAVPLAHPGFFGTANRNKGQKVTDKLELQLKDWENFAKMYGVMGNCKK